MLNMDFSHRVLLDSNRLEWERSPISGVWRRKLAREDAEQGRASSIVRYEAGACFSAHDHPGGEEILVLDGVFSDHSGDYPAGSYFRNPQGYRHAPFSEQGCTILVKLHQFQALDRQHVIVDTHNALWRNTDSAGVQRAALHHFAFEQVELLRFSAGSHLLMTANLGEEFYVLEGEISDEQATYTQGCWLRQPKASSLTRRASKPSLLWRKTGHINIGGAG